LRACNSDELGNRELVPVTVTVIVQRSSVLNDVELYLAWDFEVLRGLFPAHNPRLERRQGNRTGYGSPLEAPRSPAFLSRTEILTGQVSASRLLSER
jgi:hypothetical protein